MKIAISADGPNLEAKVGHRFGTGMLPTKAPMKLDNIQSATAMDIYGGHLLSRLIRREDEDYSCL